MKLIDMLVEDGLNGWRWPEGAAKATSYRHIPGVHFFDGDGHGVDYSDLNGRELSCEEVTREQYESALAVKNNGWIEWAGGECPVPGDAEVLIKCKSEGAWDFRRKQRADEVSWTHDDSALDVIAYCLHKLQEAAHAKANGKTDMNECASKDTAPVWNGSNLPPVGCFCEITDPDGMLVYGQGESGEVIAHVENTAVIRMSYGIGCFDARFLRPLRTEADRKRDSAVGKIFDVICKSLTDESESTSFAIYNAIAAGEIPGVKLEDL